MMAILPPRRALAALAIAAAVGAFAEPAAAQATGRIRGKVTEARTLRPLSGVQISLPGTGRGGLTNAAGDFLILNVPVGERTIRAEMIGFTAAEQPVRVTADGLAQVTIELAPSAISMDELVVTGTTGAVSKRTLGNSITRVDAVDVVEKTTITTVTELLQAKSPGVQILPNSGTPGAAADIRIRGASSFIGNAPVVYVDGVRYNIGDLGSFAPSGAGTTSFSAQSTSAFDFINPNDIESIEVIKGPAAATLYGAEAANGVIQIITKKGRRGEQAVQWTVRMEQGQNDWALDMPANYTTCDAAKIAAKDREGNPTWIGCQDVPEGTVLTDRPLERDPAAMRVGDMRKVSLSARGGGENYSFYFAGDHSLDEGIFPNSHNERNSIRANFVLTPNDKVDLSVNTNYARGDLRLPVGDEAFQGPLLSAFRGKPGLRTTNPKNVGWFSSRPEQFNEYNNTTESDRLTLGTTVNVNPVRWFRNRLTLGMDYTSSLAQILSPPGSADADYAGVPEGVVGQRVPRNYVYTVDYAGNIDRALTNDLQSTTSFGGQVNSRRYENLGATGTGFGAPAVVLIGTAQSTVGYNSFVESKSVGFFVQEQLGWKNRVFLTAAVRADDNSSFGENFDWIYYPKGSLSWILSEEPMVAPLFESARVSNFKFRAAYGQAGRAPSPFSASQTYTVNKAVSGEEVVSALQPLAFGNPDLVAERGKEYEIGFDAGLLDDRVGLEFTYYDKVMDDVIIPVGVAPSTGFGGTFYGGTQSLQRNLGEIANSGFEVGLNATPIQTRRFAWDTRVTLATNNNELVSFGDTTRTKIVPFAPYGSVQEHREGYPLAGYWAALPKRNADGTPVLNDRGVVQLDTATYIGPSAPTREIGFANTFTVMRDFRVFVLFDYKGGHYLYNYKEYNRCRFQANCEAVNDPSRADDPELPVLRQVPSAYIEKADFVKLRDVSLTYTLPSEWVRRFRATGASFTLAGHNLAQWTDYSGIDPETNTYGNRDFVRADIYALPMMRRLTAGLNLSF